jgi:hypothetical protein
MRKGSDMARQRFDQLLEAYGADFARWPNAERDAGAAFAAANSSAVAASMEDERALDASLDAARVDVASADLLAARILAAHKRNRDGGFDWRAAAALAACAVFGVLLGYGGGLMTPVADDEAAYFASAFEAPFADLDGEEG